MFIKNLEELEETKHSLRFGFPGLKEDWIGERRLTHPVAIRMEKGQFSSATLFFSTRQ